MITVTPRSPAQGRSRPLPRAQRPAGVGLAAILAFPRRVAGPSGSLRLVSERNIGGSSGGETKILPSPRAIARDNRTNRPV
jgi:hypothetical protein